MTSHVHEWSRDTRRDRFTCTVPGCLVVGYAARITPGQLRGASSGVVPYVCRAWDGKRPDRKRCGREATEVTGDLTQSRCPIHTTKGTP